MKTITDDELLEYASEQEGYFVVQPGDIREAILEELANGSQVHGDRMPWKKTHPYFAFRPHEVSVWAGINGHGKSNLMGQVMAHLCRDTRVVIASLEMPLRMTVSRMVKQMAGTAEPSPIWVNKAINWLDDNRLWLYDVLDTVEAERVVALCYYATRKLEAKHVVIDSLVKCGLHGVDGQLHKQQRDFVDHLCRIARTTGLHIHLVHHMRKGDSEERIPDKFSIKGAGEIADLADNILIVHRNLVKERKIRAGEDVDPELYDTKLRIAKQRHFSWEGSFNLWFDPPSGQYVAKHDHKPLGWQL